MLRIGKGVKGKRQRGYEDNPLGLHRADPPFPIGFAFLIDFVFLCHDSAVFERVHTTFAAPSVPCEGREWNVFKGKKTPKG